MVIILWLGTQFLYISDRESIAIPLSPPIKTLSGLIRSLIAVPSARNSGLDKTSNVFLVLFFKSDIVASLRIDFITSAVLTGSVLFSTTIV